jgi:hypothetical protein
MPISDAERARRCRRRRILGRKLIAVELDEIAITEVLLSEGLIGPEAALDWKIVAAAAKKIHRA